MKVILKEKIASLGNVGEVINVSPGHARNFLFPQKLAVFADEGNKKFFENQKRALGKKIEAEKDEASAIKSKLDGLVIELCKKVGSNGKLFGTVTTSELSKELAKQEIPVEKRLLSIKDPIKSTGTFNVKVRLFQDIVAEFKVKVEMDPKQAEELKKKSQMAAKKKAKSKEPAKDKKEKALKEEETADEE